MDVVHSRVAAIDVHKKVIWAAARIPARAGVSGRWWSGASRYSGGRCRRWRRGRPG